MKWTRDTVITCDHCNEAMIPNVSTWDEEGCAWICTTADCPDFTANEIEAEDLEAVGVPSWAAERVAILAELIMRNGEGEEE